MVKLILKTSNIGECARLWALAAVDQGLPIKIIQGGKGKNKLPKSDLITFKRLTVEDRRDAKIQVRRCRFQEVLPMFTREHIKSDEMSDVVGCHGADALYVVDCYADLELLNGTTSLFGRAGTAVQKFVLEHMHILRAFPTMLLDVYMLNVNVLEDIHWLRCRISRGPFPDCPNITWERIEETPVPHIADDDEKFKIYFSGYDYLRPCTFDALPAKMREVMSRLSQYVI
jgi:hypothetical protein